MRLKNLSLFAVLCIIWGSTWFASRVLVDQIPPIRSAAFRFLLAAILLLPMILVRKLPLPRGRPLAANLILSATMIALPYALIFWAQTRVSLGMTAVLFALTPLVAGLFGHFIGSPSMPQSAMYALILGVAGTVLLLSSALSISLEQAGGASAILLAVLSAAISSVYAKRELAEIHPLISTMVQLSGAGILLFLLSAIAERGQLSNWTGASVSALLSLSIVASSVAYPLYFWLLKGMEPWQIGTIQWFEPLIAILEGALLFREPLSWRMIGGTAILLVGVARVMTAQSKDDDAVTLKITVT